ncbi:MAG: DUF1178 family protein [Hyphomicrobiaceae bacterium]|nr:DUF1178 family protein [Hyphomicrobiaceae bacterium]
MIRYRLACGKRHEFESWFASSDSYDQLEAAHQVSCPICGDTDVSKTLMAPNIVARSSTAPGTSQPAEADPPGAALLDGNPDGDAVAVARKIKAMIRELHEKVQAEAEYVGPRFAEEARRIHFNEVSDRPIYGEATASDVQSLAEDGIEVMPLPRLPKDLS